MSSSIKKGHATPSDSRTPVPLASTIGRRVHNDTPRTPCTPSASAVPVNDDEAERRQRRLHNMCTMISPGCHTPKSATHSDQSRSHDASTGSLSNTQLAEHYANCIKLSSQNKISAKNAFGLHLIDHMFKLLKMRGEMSNFQIASSTLDAGAKIYAGRVDSIYNDAFKVLGGLGREHQASKEGEGGGGEEGEGGEVKRPGRRTKKSTIPGLTIEKDPTSLNLPKFDLGSRIDPLFQKTAAAFDEGGVRGLFLNNLMVQDDNCSLPLDASQMPVVADAPAEGVMVQIEDGLFDLSSLNTRQICPTFADFKFNSGADGGGSWNLGSGRIDEIGGASRGGGVEQDADFTMLDCPPTAPDYGAHDDGEEGFGDVPAMDANADLAYNVATRGDTTVLGMCSDNQVAQYVPAAGAESEKTSGPLAPGMGDLCLTDLIVPSDYSYFDPAVIASWAGPQHWKFRPRNAPKKAEGVNDTKPKTRKKKASNFRVDFTTTPKKSLFATGKASTQLSKTALAKLESSLTTLPQDIRTDLDALYSLFCRPEWKIKRQKKQSGVVDDGLEGNWYDYNNANDQLNYCPPIDDGDESDAAMMDETAPQFYSNSQGFLNETDGPLPIPGAMELIGDNLVTQPQKVNQIQIDYARSAKKIDVKKLKGKMWDVIAKPQDQTDSSESEGVGFSAMYSELPSLVTKAMAKNISVSICFVCLLHLANEKELKLSSKTDLSDFEIFTTKNSN